MSSRTRKDRLSLRDVANLVAAHPNTIKKLQDVELLPSVMCGPELVTARVLIELSTTQFPANRARDKSAASTVLDLIHRGRITPRTRLVVSETTVVAIEEDYALLKALDDSRGARSQVLPVGQWERDYRRDRPDLFADDLGLGFRERKEVVAA